MGEKSKGNPIEFEQQAPKALEVLKITRRNSDFSFELNEQVIGYILEYDGFFLSYATVTLFNASHVDVKIIDKKMCRDGFKAILAKSKATAKRPHHGTPKFTFRFFDYDFTRDVFGFRKRNARVF